MLFQTSQHNDVRFFTATYWVTGPHHRAGKTVWDVLQDDPHHHVGKITVGSFDHPAQANRALEILQKWNGWTQADILRRYPRLCAHIIAESLGYATPNHAALLLKRGFLGLPDWCEWLAACYQNDTPRMLRDAINRRRHHTGYMGSAQAAYNLIQAQLHTGNEPILASWF